MQFTSCVSQVQNSVTNQTDAASIPPQENLFTWAGRQVVRARDWLIETTFNAARFFQTVIASIAQVRSDQESVPQLIGRKISTELPEGLSKPALFRLQQLHQDIGSSSPETALNPQETAKKLSKTEQLLAEMATEKMTEEAALQFIEMGADVNASDNNGDSILHWACDNGHKKLVTLLLERNGFTDNKDKDGETALLAAVSSIKGSEDSALQLIEKGADINAVDKDGNSVLHWACWANFTKLIVQLLEKNVSVECKNKNGKTALLAAVSMRNANEDVALQLIEKGADVKAIDKDGNSVLHWACRTNSKKLIAQLFEKGVNVNRKSKNGETPLLVAVENASEDIALLLIEKGADINAVDKDGNSVLHWACWANFTKLIVQLLEKNGFTDNKDKDGETPLLAAVSSVACSEDIIALQLIAKGADVNAIDKDGNSVLHWACLRGYKKLVTTLLERNGFTDHKNKHDDTPLLLAVNGYSKKHEDTALQLLAKGADLNAVNNFGESILQRACSSGFQRLILALVEKEANLKTKSKDGETPLLWATWNTSEGMEEIAVQLIELAFSQGANLNDANKGGETIRSLAIKTNKFRVLELLKTLDKAAGKEVDRRHLQELVTLGQIPVPSENVPLEALLALFDAINFSDPTKPFYVDVQKFSGESRASSVADLRQYLGDEKDDKMGLIGFVKNKTAYLATPKAGSPALIEFYTQIERALQHCIIKLQSLPDTKESQIIKARVLSDFVQASPRILCGIRMYANTLLIYMELVKNQKPTLKNGCLNHLAEERHLILRTLTETTDVHEYNYLMHTLGEELNVPLAEQFKSIEDVCADGYKRSINLDIVRRKFYGSYHSDVIVKSLKQKIESEERMLHQFFDWCKMNIPIEFERRKFDEIRASVQIWKQESMTDKTICQRISEQYGIDVEVRSLDEAIQLEIGQLVEKDCSAIRAEVDALKEKNLEDAAIRKHLLEKQGLELQPGHLRLSLENVLREKRKSQVEIRFQALKKEIEPLKAAKKTDEEIVAFLLEQKNMVVQPRNLEQALTCSREHLYIRQEVKQGENGVKEALVFALCRDIGVLV